MMEKKNQASTNSNPSGGGFMSGLVNSIMGSKNKKVVNPVPQQRTTAGINPS
jgi:hypothetical protein